MGLRFSQWTVKAVSLALSLACLFPGLAWAFERPGFPQASPTSPKLLLSPALGTAEEIASGRGKTVFLIQDLHCHYGVQKNISRILEKLVREQGVRLVGEEGACEEVYAGQLRHFPIASVREAVSDYLVREGHLTGAEYFAANGEAPIRLVGIETPALHRESETVIGGLLQSETQGLCLDLRNALETLKLSLFNPKLKDYDTLFQAWKTEKFVPGRIAQRLQKIVRKQGIAWPGDHPSPEPNRTAVAGFDREARLRLYQNEYEKQLDRLLEHMSVLEHMLTISASQEELAEYARHPSAYRADAFRKFIREHQAGMLETLDPDLGSLDGKVEDALKFYALADQRSRAFVENFTRKLEAAGQARAVMIAGGFHAPRILAELKRKGIGCVSIQPAITPTDVPNPYFSVLQGRLTPLEKQLEKTPGFFAPETGLADSPAGVLWPDNLTTGRKRRQAWATAMLLVLQQLAAAPSRELRSGARRIILPELPGGPGLQVAGGDEPDDATEGMYSFLPPGFSVAVKRTRGEIGSRAGGVQVGEVAYWVGATPGEARRNRAAWFAEHSPARWRGSAGWTAAVKSIRAGAVSFFGGGEARWGARLNRSLRSLAGSSQSVFPSLLFFPLAGGMLLLATASLAMAGDVSTASGLLPDLLTHGIFIAGVFGLERFRWLTDWWKRPRENPVKQEMDALENHPETINLPHMRELYKTLMIRQTRPVTAVGERRDSPPHLEGYPGNFWLVYVHRGKRFESRADGLWIASSAELRRPANLEEVDEFWEAVAAANLSGTGPDDKQILAHFFSLEPEKLAPRRPASAQIDYFGRVNWLRQLLDEISLYENFLTRSGLGMMTLADLRLMEAKRKWLRLHFLLLGKALNLSSIGGRLTDLKQEAETEYAIEQLRIVQELRQVARPAAHDSQRLSLLSELAGFGSGSENGRLGDLAALEAIRLRLQLTKELIRQISQMQARPSDEERLRLKRDAIRRLGQACRMFGEEAPALDELDIQARTELKFLQTRGKIQFLLVLAGPHWNLPEGKMSPRERAFFSAYGKTVNVDQAVLARALQGDLTRFAGEYILSHRLEALTTMFEFLPEMVFLKSGLKEWEIFYLAEMMGCDLAAHASLPEVYAWAADELALIFASRRKLAQRLERVPAGQKLGDPRIRKDLGDVFSDSALDPEMTLSTVLDAMKTARRQVAETQFRLASVFSRWVSQLDVNFARAIVLDEAVNLGLKSEVELLVAGARLLSLPFEFENENSDFGKIRYEREPDLPPNRETLEKTYPLFREAKLALSLLENFGVNGHARNKEADLFLRTAREAVVELEIQAALHRKLLTAAEPGKSENLRRIRSRLGVEGASESERNTFLEARLQWIRGTAFRVLKELVAREADFNGAWTGPYQREYRDTIIRLGHLAGWKYAPKQGQDHDSYLAEIAIMMNHVTSKLWAARFFSDAPASLPALIYTALANGIDPRLGIRLLELGMRGEMAGLAVLGLLSTPTVFLGILFAWIALHPVFQYLAYRKGAVDFSPLSVARMILALVPYGLFMAPGWLGLAGLLVAWGAHERHDRRVAEQQDFTMRPLIPWLSAWLEPFVSRIENLSLSAAGFLGDVAVRVWERIQAYGEASHKSFPRRFTFDRMV